jgi:cyclopropane fatty-acyl-phospholipid synthase-like methyltransferase
MNDYKETFATWNKIAQIYEDKFMNLDLYNQTYDLFCEAITAKNPTVLELGCGPGNITKYLLTKRPDFEIDAVDVAPNMIALAQQNNPTAQCKVMDVREIDCIQKEYDAIVCGFCIPYLSATDVSKLIADCHHLLMQNGVIYLSFVAGDYDQSDFQKGSSSDRVYFYYHSLESVVQSFEKQGFSVDNLIAVKYPKNDNTEEIHTIIIARKTTV